MKNQSQKLLATIKYEFNKEVDFELDIVNLSSLKYELRIYRKK